MKITVTFFLLAALLAQPSFAETKPAPAASKQPAVSKLDPAMGANKQADAKVVWHDVTQWGVEGRGWGNQERKRWFDRFPAKAEGKVTAAVWSHSRDSAGMMVRFKTDSAAIHARYTLMKPVIGLPHMPATGVSGLDLYARDDSGKWKWVQVTKPTGQTVSQQIISGLAPGLREYAAYLPLYNGIEKLEIGVEQGAKFEGLAPRTERPVVFYGTSITHGACASRPGMVHTAILGRRLDRPVINCGFSGNGRMDPSVGELLIELDAAVYVIDCLPNMQPAMVAERTVPLVKQLRAAKPDTPIVLVEDRRFTNDWITPAKHKFHTDNHAALKKAFAELQAAGVKNLHYIPGDHLYGDDTEGATDASHASDLGFMRQADIFEPVLRAALATATSAKGKGVGRAPAASQPIALLDGKSLDDWQSVDIGGSGEVVLENGSLIIRTGDSVSGAVYKKADQLPLTNYEITLQARRLQGVDFFCGLTFPVGSLQTCATLVLGGWGGSVTGISCIDGMDAAENSTGTYQRYEDNKWYAVRLRVTPKNLSAWVSEKQVVDVDIEGKKIGLRPGPIESYAPLSLTTFATEAEIKDVKLTPITAL